MTTPSRSDRYKKSRELLDRARSVIPSGIWGHNRFPAFLSPGNYPYFAHRGLGRPLHGYRRQRICRLYLWLRRNDQWICKPRQWTAPPLLRLSDGDCLNQPTEVSVELAELLCSSVRDVDWCTFGKNGSDALATAIVIARAHTSRQDLVCINGSYHGSHFWCNWCNPGEGRPARGFEARLPRRLEQHRSDAGDL